MSITPDSFTTPPVHPAKLYPNFVPSFKLFISKFWLSIVYVAGFSTPCGNVPPSNSYVILYIFAFFSAVAVNSMSPAGIFISTFFSDKSDCSSLFDEFHFVHVTLYPCISFTLASIVTICSYLYFNFFVVAVSSFVFSCAAWVFWVPWLSWVVFSNVFSFAKIPSTDTFPIFSPTVIVKLYVFLE